MPRHRKLWAWAQGSVGFPCPWGHLRLQGFKSYLLGYNKEQRNMYFSYLQCNKKRQQLIWGAFKCACLPIYPDFSQPHWNSSSCSPKTFRRTAVVLMLQSFTSPHVLQSPRHTSVHMDSEVRQLHTYSRTRQPWLNICSMPTEEPVVKCCKKAKQMSTSHLQDMLW